jgi:hypothetical protein
MGASCRGAMRSRRPAVRVPAAPPTGPTDPAKDSRFASVLRRVRPSGRCRVHPHCLAGQLQQLNRVRGPDPRRDFGGLQRPRGGTSVTVLAVGGQHRICFQGSSITSTGSSGPPPPWGRVIRLADRRGAWTVRVRGDLRPTRGQPGPGRAPLQWATRETSRPPRPHRPGAAERWRRCRSPATATGVTPSPTPGPCPTTAARQEPWRARCDESRTPGSASGLGKRTGSNPGTAPQADSTGEGGGGLH